MGTRELKEEALHLYARRRFAECARTYEKLLALEPGDPSLYLRQAEACRRAGARREAMAAYRMAAELWTRLGNEHRARAALKVALELEPRNPEVERELTRLMPTLPPAPLNDLGLEWAEPEEWLSGESLDAVRQARAQRDAAELRRLSDNTLAVRAAPGMPWWVVSSRTPVLAYEVEDLAEVEVRDHALEVTLMPEL